MGEAVAMVEDPDRDKLLIVMVTFGEKARA